MRKISSQVVVASIISLLAGMVLSYYLPHPSRNTFQVVKPSGNFGEIWQVYTYKPEVSATAYNSKSGNATVIWVSDFTDTPKEFGEIQQVYTFKPDVSATAYQSQKGGATIIWVSGMDDEPSPSKGTTF